jgi:hypothetical protein
MGKPAAAPQIDLGICIAGVLIRKDMLDFVEAIIFQSFSYV